MTAIIVIAIFVLVLWLQIAIRNHNHPEYRQPYGRLQRTATFEMRQMVFRYAQVSAGLYQCAYCGRTGNGLHDPDGETWEVDHVLPWSWGGTTTLDNLTLACRTCNQTKGANVWPVRFGPTNQHLMLPPSAPTTVPKETFTPFVHGMPFLTIQPPDPPSGPKH